MRYLARQLYVWVLIAIVLGGVVGYATPATAVALRPLGDGFIAAIRMLVSPIIFITIVLGIAGTGDTRKAGRIGIKSVLYFEVVSTLALLFGLLAVKVLQPGVGFNVDPTTLDAAAARELNTKAQAQGGAEFLLHLIPKTFADAFTANGDLLQVVLIAIVFGVGLAQVRAVAAPLIGMLEALAAVFFRMVALIMRLAPVGAGAAMAFTIGRYGLASVGPLLKLLATVYLACAGFVVVVLGIVARYVGFRVFELLRYLREEILLVLGTSSSESALVPLMQKLERLGCSRPVVSLVVPVGYSFNLDGTNIYLAVAAFFVAQALNVPLTPVQQATLIGVAMLTSKGASGVTGAGFVTLAATLAVVPSVPIAGLTLILGVDRFMSEARALTNMIGNAVATVVVAKWEGELDREQLTAELRKRGPGIMGNANNRGENELSAAG